MKPFQAARALEAIDLLACTDAPTQIVVEDIVVVACVEVVEVEAFFAGATDPNSGLCLGAGMVYNMSPEIRHPFWEHEFLVPDFNKFIHLSPTQPVADLRRGHRRQTLPEPPVPGAQAESPTSKTSYGPCSMQGRAPGASCNSTESKAAGHSTLPSAGSCLMSPLSAERRSVEHYSASPPGPIGQRATGMLILGPDGKVVDATQEAEDWLQDVAAGWRIYDDSLLHPELLDLALAVSGKDQAPRRATLRTIDGVWLTVQVSPLSESDNVALIIQPAKASEILPLLLRVYGLSKREAEIAQLISKGLTTQEIAERLFLSQHTVRDHVKAIFEKIQVSSRGELTSKLFFEQNLPELEKAVLESFNRL